MSHSRYSWFALLCAVTPNALAEWGLNLTVGVTPISKQVYGLHMTILYICVAIGVIVFGVMIWSIFHHRKSRGFEAAQFHDSPTAELVWTVVPMLILVVMAIPATKTLVAMEDVGDPDMTIKVTGYQWKWHYEYLDEGISFFSLLDPASNEARQLRSGIDPASVENYLLEVDNRVIVPVDKKIRVLTTAADVIHAWWVPAIGWKRDSIPGFINESWMRIEQPGVYRGQCAELCGKDHGFMPVVIQAVDEATYRQWVETMQAQQAERDAIIEMSKDELMVLGETVFTRMCAVCHQANGEGLPPTYPSMVGSAIVTGPLAGHIDIVLNGSASNSLMQAFGKQLTAAELAAVITFERNSWGNGAKIEAGTDVVQPAEIKAVMEGTE